MKMKNIILVFLAGVTQYGSLLSTPAITDVKSFSAIDGIEAQALTATEMDAIHSEDHLDALIARRQAGWA